MENELPTLEEWLKEYRGKYGVCGFCEGCGKDWDDLPWGKVAKEGPNIWYWVCSRDCMNQITKDIEIGIRYQKSRFGE